MDNPLQCCVEFKVGGEHDPPGGMSSTMPLRPPSRLTCQNSIAACSSGQAANLRSQKTLAPKYAWAAAWSKSSRARPASCDTSKVSAMTEEDVDIVGFDSVRDE